MIVGITGGIGCGKSVVSKIIDLMGYPIYDSDKNAKKLTDESNKIRQGLIIRFGQKIYEGERLNRKLLAKEIFTDEENRAYVNELIHPVVLDDFLQWSKSQLKNNCIVFIESAILFESGFYKYVDKILLVTSSQDLRIERIKKRDNLPVEDIMSRLNSQLSQDYLLERADFIVQNDEKKSLLKQIIMLFDSLNV